VRYDCSAPPDESSSFPSFFFLYFCPDPLQVLGDTFAKRPVIAAVAEMKDRLDQYSWPAVYNRFKDRIESFDDDGDDTVMGYMIAMRERRTYAERVITQLGIKHKIIDAITPSDLSIVDYAAMSDTLDPRNNMMYLKPTKLPVSLSFFMTFFDAFLHQHGAILVLEDDVKFDTSVADIKSILDEFMAEPECQVLYLGYCLPYPSCEYIQQGSKKLSDNLYLIPKESHLSCLHSIALKKRAINHFMRQVEDHMYHVGPSDVQLIWYFNKYQVNRCIAPFSLMSQDWISHGSYNMNDNAHLTACQMSPTVSTISTN